MDRKFFYAVSVLIGTIIGVGIFGIPYVVAQAGFLIGLIYLLVIGGVTIVIHLSYGEIILRTPGKHRLVGYAARYLGKWGKRLVSFSNIIGQQGALLAYIIVSGLFLRAIFNGSSFIWSLIFFALGAIAIFFGLRIIASAELLMVVFLLVAMAIIFIFGWSEIHLANLLNLDFKLSFLPYGVILFAFGGLAAIPEMREILINRRQGMKKAIFFGTFIPLILFIIFTLVVVGVTGFQTSQEALVGLQTVLGPRVMLAGLIFGVLALMTSFLVLGLNVKKIFWHDFKVDKTWSWILACFIPLAAFLLGLRNFIEVIAAAGAVMGGLDSIMVLVIFSVARKRSQRQPEYTLKIPRVLTYGLIGMFILGIVYQIIYFF